MVFFEKSGFCHYIVASLTNSKQSLTMRRSLTKNLLVVLFAFSTIFSTSCATVFGGSVDECQRTKPSPGQPARQVRAAALVCDILLFWPGVFVDFATHAIYKPCGR
jgi:hypothetical protein